MLATAWGGALLFLASLSYFAYFYLVQLGTPAPLAAAEAPRAILINTLLFSAFALHHSAFARAGIKAWIARALPAGLERSLYVWVASLLFLAVCRLWQPLPGMAWQATGPLRWVLHAVQLGGVVLTLRSAARIDIWELAGVPRVPRAPGDLSVPSVAEASASSAAEHAPLTVNGPYRWLRHPIYLGWVMFVFGAPIMTSGRLLFATISTVYLIVAIPFEERALTSEFGEAYREYQRQVRWRLVPGVW
jgi:protein-S-isoprenylcysteine O-methyltransferase Ste14